MSNFITLLALIYLYVIVMNNFLKILYLYAGDLYVFTCFCPVWWLILGFNHTGLRGLHVLVLCSLVFKWPPGELAWAGFHRALPLHVSVYLCPAEAVPKELTLSIESAADSCGLPIFSN